MTQQQKAPQRTHWRKVHKRKNAHLLYAEDLGPVGTEVDVEIIDTGVIVVKGIDGDTDMPWLAFRGADGKSRQKRLGLNPTNCKTVKSITNSPYVEEWRGWITLIVVETEYRDKHTGRKELTDAIRIAPRRPRRPRRDPSGRASAPADNAKDEVGSFEKDPNANPPLSDEDKRALELAENQESSNG